MSLAAAKNAAQSGARAGADADTRAASRSERTRAAVLAAAEALFAERGFAETRLEDVAAAVGIRRASIFYYFADKPALYDAVLADVFGDLRERITPALLARKPLRERTLDAVSIWIDTLAARPTLARLLLREVADGRTGDEPRLVRHTRAFFELVGRALAASDGDPIAATPQEHSVHTASVVAGSSVFFVAAMPVLIPGLGFDPLDASTLEAHRARMLETVRRLIDGAG
jgi:TetR/AcrR family transcriptional regulator